MQVTREQTAPCLVTLDIEVEPETVDRAFDRAYREFAGFTNVPGFRPGKAPRPVLERYVNQTRLRERVAEIVAGKAYREALKQEEINPYDDPDVEFSDVAQGQPFTFRATIPTPPKVTLGDCSTITVERPVYTVTDKDVDDYITSLRNEYAQLKPVTGRGVQEGDTVIAEMAITNEGEEPGETKRSLIRVGNNIPGFDDAVMGQQIDEERSFDLTYPEDYQDAEMAGKRARFTVRVMSINERIVPELTDQWVQANTTFQNADELKADSRRRLEETYKDLADRVAESRIVEELVKRSQIEYPPTMVREQVHEDMHELQDDLNRRGTEYEEYLQSAGISKEEHEARMAGQAEERVKTTLALRELVKQENLEVPTEDIDSELDRLLAESSVPEERHEEIRTDRSRRAQVANVVVKRKLRDLLFEKATVTDVPAGEKQTG